MKDIILFSVLSFVLILLSVLLFMGVIVIGPVEEPVEIEDELSLIKVRVEAIEAQRRDVRRKREENLSLRNDLELERRLIAEERQQLEVLLNRIETSLIKLDEEHLERVTKLAKLYESMKPEKAASIASSLDIKLLIEIVTRMKEKQAAKMMAELPPSLAAEVSRRIGKRGTK